MGMSEVDLAACGRASARAATPERLLDGDFDAAGLDVAADEAMACLRVPARERARVELDVGEGLLLFGRGRRFDTGTLGHSHFDDFCTNRLGVSGAHGRELRSLAASLATLPRLRQ